MPEMEDNMEDTNSVNKDNNAKPDNMRMSDRFLTAMFLPREYGKLLDLKIGKVISYFFWLVLLVSVIQYAIPALGAIAGLGGIKNIVLNEIPEFSLKEGKFSYADKVEQENNSSGMYFLVDTNVDKFTKDDIPEDAMEAILVSSTNILVCNNVSGLGGIVQEDTFDHYKDFTITNQTVADSSTVLYVVMFFVFVLLYAMTLVKYLFSGLFFAVVMHLLTRTMLMEMEFGKVYKVALFAQSIGVIVAAITYCINNTLFILAGSAFNMLITIIIMNKALIQMKMEQKQNTAI